MYVITRCIFIHQGVGCLVEGEAGLNANDPFNLIAFGFCSPDPPAAAGGGVDDFVGVVVMAVAATATFDATSFGESMPPPPPPPPPQSCSPVVAPATVLVFTFSAIMDVLAVPVVVVGSGFT